MVIKIMQYFLHSEIPANTPNWLWYFHSGLSTDLLPGFHLGFFVWGGKKSLESLTTPTFVGTLYWHVINLFCTTLGY